MDKIKVFNSLGNKKWFFKNLGMKNKNLINFQYQNNILFKIKHKYLPIMWYWAMIGSTILVHWIFEMQICVKHLSRVHILTYPIHRYTELKLVLCDINI